MDILLSVLVPGHHRSRRHAGHRRSGRHVLVTTAPAPILHPLPRRRPHITIAPEPMETSSSTCVSSSFQSGLFAFGSRSLMKITPCPTNTPRADVYALAEEGVALDARAVADAGALLDLDEGAHEHRPPRWCTRRGSPVRDRES